MVIKQGENVVLENDKNFLKIIKKESPEAYFEWSLNGILVKQLEHRITFKNNDVHISNATSSNTGVYVCVIHRTNNQRLVLKIIAIAVVSKNYDINSRATKPVTLRSNAVVLGYIYSHLSQKWILNETITYGDYGITTLAAVSAEYIEHLNYSHNGDWKCVVEQVDLKHKWITNYVRIRVKSRPTFITHLMEDRLTAPLFAWLKTETNVVVALVCVVLFVFVSVGVCAFLYMKYGRMPEKNVKRKKGKRYERLRNVDDLNG